MVLWDLEKGCLTQTRGGVWKRVQRERLEARCRLELGSEAGVSEAEVAQRVHRGLAAGKGWRAGSQGGGQGPAGKTHIGMRLVGIREELGLHPVSFVVDLLSRRLSKQSYVSTSRFPTRRPDSGHASPHCVILPIPSPEPGCLLRIPSLSWSC